ncbi:hypothetical protein QX776_05915 [Alteromonadaceae bacterium BrNp21-10]|nr:hypothetical protein [Alteromonadaceae bacterium BrNp21-10]
MRIGWRALIKQTFTRASGKNFLGIEFTEHGLHVSVFEVKSRQPLWVAQHFIELANWPKKLSQWVQDQSMQFSSCSIVLSRTQYNILLVERPKVDDQELQQALRWAAKDLISHPEDVVMDFFDQPAQAVGANKVALVTASKKVVNQVAEAFQQAQLNVHDISIEEMSLCNLLPMTDSAVIVLSQDAGHDVCLNIIKAGKLYFTRRLKGFELLSSLTLSELQSGMLESLAIEVQRSIDYYDSQLRQAPVTQVLLSLDTDFQQEMADSLKKLVFLDVGLLQPNVNSSANLKVKHAYLASLGGVLGQFVTMTESAAQ